MKIKAGTKVEVKYVIKRRFIAKAMRDFDTGTEALYPLVLMDDTLLGMGHYFSKGNVMFCNKSLIKKIKVIP